MLICKTRAMIQMHEVKELGKGLEKLLKGIERGILHDHGRGIPQKAEVSFDTGKHKFVATTIHVAVRLSQNFSAF